MKKSLLFIALSLLLFFCGFAQVVPEKGLLQINSEYLKKHIDFLASDSLKGRNTPSSELDIAASYIAEEFSRLGVKKVNGSYFQEVPLCTKNLLVDDCSLSLSTSGNSISFKLKTDFTPFANTADAEASGNVVFAGYGITAPEYNYDDYEGLDVKGKIVLVMKHEPRENDTSEVFEGKKDTYHSSIDSKLKNAMSRGAVAIMIVTDPLNHLTLNPQGYSWPNLSKFKTNITPKIQLLTHEESIPCIQVGERFITNLFGTVDSLKSIQKQIDTNLKPFSFEISNVLCSIKTKLDVKQFSSKNVVGLIKGSDQKLKNEFLVIGAHYDHVGYNDTHKEGDDYIFNGADDNASGTAGVMALAKAFSVSKKTKRSILFILFTGEEKGLFGSEYYTKNPLFPLNSTVAMLNLDMISRNGDSLQILGERFNPDLFTIIKEENNFVGLNIVESGNEFLGGSDHANFLKKDISSIFFFTGIHNDYHTVMDNPDKVDYLKAEKVTKLVFRTAWRVVNDNRHYTFNKPK